MKKEKGIFQQIGEKDGANKGTVFKVGLLRRKGKECSMWATRTRKEKKINENPTGTQLGLTMFVQIPKKSEWDEAPAKSSGKGASSLQESTQE